MATLSKAKLNKYIDTLNRLELSQFIEIVDSVNRTEAEAIKALVTQYKTEQIKSTVQDVIKTNGKIIDIWRQAEAALLGAFYYIAGAASSNGGQETIQSIRHGKALLASAMDNMENAKTDIGKLGGARLDPGYREVFKSAAQLRHLCAQYDKSDAKDRKENQKEIATFAINCFDALHALQVRTQPIETEQGTNKLATVYRAMIRKDIEPLLATMTYKKAGYHLLKTYEAKLDGMSDEEKELYEPVVYAAIKALKYSGNRERAKVDEIRKAQGIGESSMALYIRGIMRD